MSETSQVQAPSTTSDPDPAEPQGGAFRRTIRRVPVLAVLVAFTFGIALGGAVAGQPQEPQAADDPPVVVTVTATPEADDDAQIDEEPEPAPEPPRALADPDADYTRNCNYSLDFDFESDVAGEFLATTKVDNTGNVGIVVRAIATWEQLGYPPIRIVKEKRIAYGRSATIRFRRTANSAEIDRHQSADAECDVRVKLFETFGTPV